MKWEGRRESDNVEDRRGMGGRRIAAGGGAGILVVIVLALLFGVDPQQILDQVGDQQSGQISSDQPYQETPEEAQRAKFARVVLADTEDTWSSIFRQSGKQYEAPILVLYSGSVDSACGFAQSAMGPFYCPSDRKVYLDLSFFDDMDGKLQAGGDFARAYVIAHEVGHHIQTLLGTTQAVAAQRGAGDGEGAGGLSVRTELQADCYAGVWAKNTETQKQILEDGDIDEALNAAAAVGDDRLQQRSRGYVVPESFTHGTSAQRSRWFRRGFDSGDANQCDTFSAGSL
ncbi:MAG: flagellar biosynthesis protein FlgM [Alphaproteobacteria bacterium]|nr:flagellar biosynthesis protein FlgM [Alphaproteobacteria bacterium]